MAHQGKGVSGASAPTAMSSACRRGSVRRAILARWRQALVHRPVGLRHLVARQSQVEDLAGLDRPAPDQIDKLGRVPANGRGSAVQVEVSGEELLAIEFDPVRHADEPT
jgi:hypothetical protein